MVTLLHGLTRFRCHEDKLNYNHRIQDANIQQIWAEGEKGQTKRL